MNVNRIDRCCESCSAVATIRAEAPELPTAELVAWWRTLVAIRRLPEVEGETR